MKRNACQKCVFAVRDDNPHCGLRGFTTSFNVEWCEAENDKVPNGYELQEDGYFSWVKKKNKYPKTYEECCEIIHSDPKFYVDTHLYSGTLEELYKLLICRDAYWKIAGDWEEKRKEKAMHYVICSTLLGEVVKDSMPNCIANYLLDFPTPEVRDAFKENFKEEIEMCKELL